MGEVVAFAGRDTLQSLVAGLGDPMRDKMATAIYGAQYLDDAQLANIYRSNWIGRKIVDVPAMDAIRKGRDWQAAAGQIELIEAEENRLGLWPKLLEVKIKARLWGGAALFIGTGDQDLTQPLIPERLGKQGIKYLTVLSRRDIAAGEIEQDVLSEFYGRPAWYEITGSSASSMVRIHPSRMVVFIGSPHGDRLMAAVANQGWGDSILEAVYSAVRNADATAANIASLVFEANVDVVQVPDLMMHLAAGEDYKNRMLERFSFAAVAKGINKMLMLDGEEKYERKQVSFATLPDVMQTFLQMVAGAADIPATRLLGQSPAGMSATGESDMNNYYDRISSIQNLEITPALYRLDECLIRSALGSRPPEIYYSWAPLKQMTKKELAEIGKLNAETAKIFVDTGIFMAQELRTVVTNQLVESGYYPGLDQAVDDTGSDWEKQLEEDKASEAKAAEAAAQANTPVTTADAAPRTLYVCRKVLNGAEIIAWAKGQGFTTTLPADDLHVTIAYSRTPVDWMKVDEDWNTSDKGDLTVAPGGPRVMERFGEATVLCFQSWRIQYRHNAIKDAGASWDHPEYHPHITISYEGAPADLSKVEPYQGEILLGPEIFQEVKEDRQAGVEEA
jgi:phage-related protein (TIGR01555 family)